MYIECILYIFNSLGPHSDNFSDALLLSVLNIALHIHERQANTLVCLTSLPVLTAAAAYHLGMAFCMY